MPCTSDRNRGQQQGEGSEEDSEERYVFLAHLCWLGFSFLEFVSSLGRLASLGLLGSIAPALNVVKVVALSGSGGEEDWNCRAGEASMPP